jgi:NarL family two-component system sensor histidine kinase YdfH
MTSSVFSPLLDVPPYNVHPYNGVNQLPEYNKCKMETKRNWRKTIRQLFIPEVEGYEETFKEVLPFFILVTLVMGGMYTLTLVYAPALDDPLRLAAFSLLFFIHLILYWMSIYFSQSERRTILYLIIQGSLAFILVLISEDINLVIALYASLTGTTVGMLGRKRTTIISGIFYTILAFLSFILISDFGVLRQLFIFFLAAIGFSAFFAYAFFRQMEAREKAHNLLQELEKAHQQLAEYALEVENLTLTNERQRMARELHDTLAQGVAGLILQLEAANIHIEQKNSGKTQEILQQALTRARATLVDARRAIADLRIELSDPQSLGEGITREVERFRNATGIPCELSLDLPETITDEMTEHIFRTITEGLGNIARHAQASHAGIKFSSEDNQLVVRIWDDGIGFDPEAEITRSGHYGLLGIRERARLAGGILKIESSPGAGTQIHLSLPTGEETHG